MYVKWTDTFQIPSKCCLHNMLMPYVFQIIDIFIPDIAHRRITLKHLIIVKFPQLYEKDIFSQIFNKQLLSYKFFFFFKLLILLAPIKPDARKC